MQIIGGHDTLVAGWAGEQLGVRFQEPYTAFGFADDGGAMRGACIFNDYYPGGNVEWTYVGPFSFSRSSLYFMARFCFDELKASRVTAKTKRSNVRVQKLLNRGGFSYETTQKRYFGPTKKDDAIVFVMTREGAKKWLGERDEST